MESSLPPSRKIDVTLQFRKRELKTKHVSRNGGASFANGAKVKFASSLHRLPKCIEPRFGCSGQFGRWLLRSSLLVASPPLLTPLN